GLAGWSGDACSRAARTRAAGAWPTRTRAPRPDTTCCTSDVDLTGPGARGERPGHPAGADHAAGTAGTSRAEPLRPACCGRAACARLLRTVHLPGDEAAAAGARCSGLGSHLSAGAGGTVPGPLRPPSGENHPAPQPG